jgi:hypothetical protein
VYQLTKWYTLPPQPPLIGYDTQVNQRSNSITYKETITTIHEINNLLRKNTSHEERKQLIIQRETLHLSLKR